MSLALYRTLILVLGSLFSQASSLTHTCESELEALPGSRESLEDKQETPPRLTKENFTSVGSFPILVISRSLQYLSMSIS